MMWNLIAQNGCCYELGGKNVSMKNSWKAKLGELDILHEVCYRRVVEKE